MVGHFNSICTAQKLAQGIASTPSVKKCQGSNEEATESEAHCTTKLLMSLHSHFFTSFSPHTARHCSTQLESDVAGLEGWLEVWLVVWLEDWLVPTIAASQQVEYKSEIDSKYNY